MREFCDQPKNACVRLYCGKYLVLCIFAGKLEKFVDTKWRIVPERERLQLTKTDGQVLTVTRDGRYLD